MSRSSEPKEPRRPLIANLARLVLWPVRLVTKSDVASANINRLLTSRHVEDLQIIMAMAWLFLWAAVVIGAPLSWSYQYIERVTGDHPGILLNQHDKMVLATRDFLTFFGPILAGVGAVIAWSYQAGSTRLGVVDLFACEISTLCNVSAVVDVVRGYVTEFNLGAGSAPAAKGASAHPFTSQENYFPVFDNNARDLQSLEAKVVIHITAFYTYMKTVRDNGRGLAAVGPSADDLEAYDPASSVIGPWRDKLRTLIYMLFLGLESGRKAIDHLVEFDPERAERTVVVLISELEAYAFLCQQYPDPMEYHHQRIVLREIDYRRIVPKLVAQIEDEYRKAEKNKDEDPRTLMRWEPAARLVPELWSRFQTAVLAPPPTAVDKKAGGLSHKRAAEAAVREALEQIAQRAAIQPAAQVPRGSTRPRAAARSHSPTHP